MNQIEDATPSPSWRMVRRWGAGLPRPAYQNQGDRLVPVIIGYQDLLLRRTAVTMIAAPARMSRRDESRKMLWSLRWVG